MARQREAGDQGCPGGTQGGHGHRERGRPFDPEKDLPQQIIADCVTARARLLDGTMTPDAGYAFAQVGRLEVETWELWVRYPDQLDQVIARWKAQRGRRG